MAERVKIAMGGDKKNPNVIEVIGIACDECPVSGYRVGPDCRGCIAHRCSSACPRGAISFDDNHHAHIDPDKCVNCGKCASVCPYSAIRTTSAPASARLQGQGHPAGRKPCGAYRRQQVHRLRRVRLYQCPFGAIQDKELSAGRHPHHPRQRKTTRNTRSTPSWPLHLQPVRVCQAGAGNHGPQAAGILQRRGGGAGRGHGLLREARELAEKGFLTSSCCPPPSSATLKELPHAQALRQPQPLSHGRGGALHQGHRPDAKIIFIGPCTAKKVEFQREEVRPWIDCVLTFEELQAWFDSKDLDLPSLDEDVLDNASYFGRIFARSGGRPTR